MRLFDLTAMLLVGGSLLLTPAREATAQPSAASENAVSSALRSIFSPRRAPPHRTMGLSQRTFLDLVEESRPKIEIAIVIDGTDSMSDALAGVRDAIAQMMRDLKLYEGRDIAYQVVVFRDSGAPSGEVALPLAISENAFTPDDSAVLTAIESLRPESGAPYFHELIDEGVRQAIADLGWSSDEDSSRWIFVFGDAPPFSPTLAEEQSGAKRRIATDALLALAASRGIQVNCVLCPARQADQAAFEAVLDETRDFMSRLSTGTGGLMLDLSYDDIRTAVVNAAQSVEVEYAAVGGIRREDVDRARAAWLEPPSPSDAPVAVAILPHGPLEDPDFSTDLPGVQLATELRLRVKSIAGITAIEPLLVQRGVERLTRKSSYGGLRGPELLKAIAATVGADYVLWGDLTDRGANREVTTRMYNAVDGRVVAAARRATGSGIRIDQLGALLAGDVLSSSIAAADHPALSNRLIAARDNAALSRAVTRPIASNRAHRALVTGLAALEKAVAYEAADREGGRLLAKAIASLTTAVGADDANALPHFLLASAHFNSASQAQLAGRDATPAIKAFGRHLRSAYRFRNALPDGPLRREIEADYALLIRKRPAEAIPIYVQLADRPTADDSGKRASWMLAGVYGGDWGVDPQFADPAQARERLIQILARWPNSSEARFIKRVLRWDDDNGETRFEHFPRENARLADQVESGV